MNGSECVNAANNQIQNVANKVNPFCTFMTNVLCLIILLAYFANNVDPDKTAPLETCHSDQVSWC